LPRLRPDSKQKNTPEEMDTVADAHEPNPRSLSSFGRFWRNEHPACALVPCYFILMALKTSELAGLSGTEEGTTRTRASTGALVGGRQA
jgi:hypothetical protein